MSEFRDAIRTSSYFLGMGVACLLSVPLHTSSGWAQESAANEYRMAQFARMQKIAESFVVSLPGNNEDRIGKLQPSPVLRYADPTRQNDEATLWIWSERNRPVAFLAVEYYPKPPHGPGWLFEVSSLSPEKITVQRGKEIDWEAREPGQNRQKIDDGPEPAATAATRQIQLKQLRQRFGAHEKTPTEGRIQLRSLPNPLYRYEDRAAGLFDGAVFAFANGTNPEVLLILEVSRERAGGPSQWTYAFGQMTGGEVYATLDDVEVWTQVGANPPAVRAAYVNGWLKDAALSVPESLETRKP